MHPSCKSTTLPQQIWTTEILLHLRVLPKSLYWSYWDIKHVNALARQPYLLSSSLGWKPHLPGKKICAEHEKVFFRYKPLTVSIYTLKIVEAGRVYSSIYLCSFKSDMLSHEPQLLKKERRSAVAFFQGTGTWGPSGNLVRWAIIHPGTPLPNSLALFKILCLVTSSIISYSLLVHCKTFTLFPNCMLGVLISFWSLLCIYNL